MSLLDELTAELRATIDDLPLPTLRHAMTEAHRAYDGLAAVNRLDEAGSGDAGLRHLGAATSHLENGAGLIMRAQDEVGAYLTEIGGDRRTVVIGAQRAEPSELWWARRIAADDRLRHADQRTPAADEDAPHDLASEARVSALTNRADVTDLLPGLPARITAMLLAHAWGDAATARPADVDPADLAVGAAVIAARLGHQLGRDTVEAAHA